jgi:hypothetical protein
MITREESVRVGRITVAAIATLTMALLTIGGGTPGMAAEHGGHRHSGRCTRHTSQTGNTISECPPAHDPYVPDIQGASPDDVQRARALYAAATRFCQTHPTVRSLQARGFYRRGAGNSHWSDGPNEGWDPDDPKAVHVEKGRVIGVIYIGDVGREWRPLPYLGSIPRPHVHHAGGREMLHVWCASTMREAFTTRKPVTVEAIARMEGG